MYPDTHITAKNTKGTTTPYTTFSLSVNSCFVSSSDKTLRKNSLYFIIFIFWLVTDFKKKPEHNLTIGSGAL